jgi:Fe-S cluster assembly scaffold protein SufB
VPAGVRVERPLVLRWVLGAPRTLVGRTLIVLGDGAEASVVEELVAPEGTRQDGQALFCTTTEIRLGAHARLAMASLQELGPDHVVFQQRRAEIGEAADLRWALAQLGGRLVRSRVDNVLAGDRSTVEQVEIVFGADEQLHDLTSYTRHVGRDTSGQLLSKGVLMDRARAYMKGLISIEKTAIGTDSYLGEFGMNLSKSARAVAIPSLEIDQPDCRRAAHSSSVGPIDDTQLFYLESRGIPPDEARKFIVLGFLEPVVARVPLEEAQDRLRHALEAKWVAGLAAGAASAA